MTTLSKDEIVKMAREASFSQDWQFAVPPATLSNFAALCRAPLIAELEQAKKDAERYRWLQPALISGGALDDDHTLTKAFQHMTTIPTKEEFNAAIDAAIAKEQV